MFSRSRKHAEPQSSLQELRRNQITSLYTHNLSIRELQPESLYEITVVTPTNLTFILTVELPSSFPDIAPTIHVKPSLQHAWINSQGYVVGHEKLATWNSQVVLGKVLKEIVQEFTVRPPHRPPPSIAPVQSSMQGHMNSQPSIGTAPGLPAAMEPAVQEFAEIDRPDELQELLKSDDALEVFFGGLEHVRSMKQVHTDLLSENETIARKNLERESALSALQEALKEQYTLMRSQKQLFDEAVKTHDDESLRFRSDYVTSTLRVALGQSDELSDSIANSFVDGKLGVEDFLKQFRDIRRVYHLRAAKLERISREPNILEA